MTLDGEETENESGKWVGNHEFETDRRIADI
ncbi:MAG: hypothetical protein K0R65_437 [Crocinitomicaceae bacterium]|jgi:hypothetical protein|nr:hypothetical protein [Crocinitomicaceae bacterium]